MIFVSWNKLRESFRPSRHNEIICFYDSKRESKTLFTLNYVSSISAVRLLELSKPCNSHFMMRKRSIPEQKYPFYDGFFNPRAFNPATLKARSVESMKFAFLCSADCFFGKSDVFLKLLRQFLILMKLSSFIFERLIFFSVSNPLIFFYHHHYNFDHHFFFLKYFR